MEQTAVHHIMPEKPPRLDTRIAIPPYSPTKGTPILTPKAGDLRSVASMPSLQSFDSLQGFQNQVDFNEFDVFDFAQLGNDAMYNDLDQLQTPDVDPLSPTFHDFHGNNSPLQHPLLTPELSGSVGSGTSLSGGSQLSIAAANGLISSVSHSQHANLMANNIEGLGIAENRPRPQLNSWPLAQAQDAQHQHVTQWPPLPSPDNALRRSKVAGPPRVTKKPSKQLLKQRKSRTNLVGEATGPTPSLPNSNTASVGRRSSSPTASSSSTLSSGSSAMANPTSPRKSQQQKNIHPASSQLTQNNGLMQKLDTLAGANQASYLQPRNFSKFPGATNEQESTLISPNTPYRKAVESARSRGKASASPAMQSPLRPGQETRLVNGLPQRPRLQTAAAATALYMPSAQQANSPRNTSMAAAAAAAAAVASYNQPVTPLADKQTARNSPSTIVMSTRTEASHRSSTIKQSPGNSLGAPSPTPAARIHSNSKLVASASDSSPAKGMWKQAGRVPLPPSQLPRPILSPRKSASTSNMRRETRRKQNKIIPEMSSSLNQFQVDLKPKHRTSKTSLAPSAPPSRTAQSAPSFFNNQLVPQYQQQQQFGNLVYDMGPIIASSAQNLPPFYPANNSQHQAMNQGMLLGASSHQNAGIHLPTTCNNLPASTHQIHGDLMMPNQGINPGPILQMPELARRSASLDHASSTVRASASTQSKVQPQGEPPQHVWASRPQAQTQTQHSQRRQFQAQVSGVPARTQSAGANPAPKSYDLPESPQFRMFEGQQQQSLMEGTGQLENFQTLYQTRAHAQAHAHTQAHAQAQAQPHGQSHPRANGQPQPLIHAAASNQVRESPIQSTPTGFIDSPSNPARHSMPDLDSRRHGLGQLNEGVQDTSITSDFMAQFINEDAWDTNEIDMGSQWDLLDALEPQM